MGYRYTGSGNWCHTYVGGTASNAVQSGGNYAHTFVSAVANGVTSNVGNLPNPVTGAVYTPNTGNLVITSNNHNLTASNTVTIADNAFDMPVQWITTLLSIVTQDLLVCIPGQTLAITNPTTNTFTVNVGASPIVGASVTSAHNNDTGMLVLNIGSHTLTAN